MKDKRRKHPTHQSKQPSKQRNKHEAKRQPEQTEGQEADNFVFGHHASVEALQAGRGNKLFLLEDARGEKIEQLKQLAKAQSVPVKWVPKQKLDKLSDSGVHQGIVLGITPYEYLSLETLLDTISNTEAPFLLILDGLEDPHNFGSILRTADASGVSGVIIPKHRSVGITPVVTKASTGAVEYVPIARVTNLSQAIKHLKEAGYWVFGTDMQGTDYRQWKVSGPIALIIGNEGKGMSAGLKKDVDEMVTIPMTGHVQSLNASVAASLLMYEVLRKRSEL
ncbi:23S rRNA (guanosine(2251)-2'-O)-methyltransferase RlmB [Enterococcus florum]|uniref:23S rRNA (Guanosine(2251)-2'-O)-methyltransferase RlmB n=1 Tax=Enterococcus florum TaxID=2480627 RepID=A0A4P5PD02_9ENTE|nr:23S rRNA (guanosine(2251)-2'-O)-methyltransferase RlmB [Enterococcus florum]GCF94201.1 23S rRNA (guanosine(2251)-2'-O)-methyltransferase RlmB [Enterococcus florum]